MMCTWPTMHTFTVTLVGTLVDTFSGVEASACG